MEDELWPAPAANDAISGRIRVPGSKSLTNRAIILAALSDGPTRLQNVLTSRDSELMVEALNRLGAQVVSPGLDELRIEPLPPGRHTRERGEGSIDPASHQVDIDCGLAGTVMRFVPPIAALTTSRVRFDGDPAARARPMAPLLTALRQLEVAVSDAGTLPFDITGTGGVSRRRATIDSSSSSQFVSALLLAAARFEQGLELRHEGAAVPSLPHIEMTTRMLAEHGVTVESDTSNPESANWRVTAGPIAALDRTIEPDLSNAMPFVAAAIVTGGRVVIDQWPTNSLQPVQRVIEVFQQLGAHIEIGDDSLVATGTGRIRGIDADLSDIGELVPTVVAVCALAEGQSELRGIGHIAGHETDRLAALATELNRFGGKVTVRADGLQIQPAPLSAGPIWQTYGDHRMATAGAIIGLATPGVLIEDIGTTAKTFPKFPDMWRHLVEPKPVTPSESDAA